MSDELHRVAEAFRATMPKHAHVSTFRIDHLDRTGIQVVQDRCLMVDHRRYGKH